MKGFGGLETKKIEREVEDRERQNGRGIEGEDRKSKKWNRLIDGAKGG